MKSSNKRKGGKCQGILRKSSQWCNWDMERTTRSEEEDKEMRKEEKRGRNSGRKGRATDDKFTSINAGENRRGMKSRNKRKRGKKSEGKEEVEEK